LMLRPGGYHAGDYWRLGLGVTLVCLVALLAALRLIWGL
jgi:di/tricarboxylate transporter